MQLLETLSHEDRIHIGRPQQGMQVKLTKPLANGNQFIAYVDALGTLDGNQSLLEWKTTSARYPDEPDGLLSLDPQLVCYSWMSGIADVSLIAFVRKRVPEIQYLKTKITDKQRQEYGNLVESTVGQIEAGQFPAHSGIPLSPKQLPQLRSAWFVPGERRARHLQTHSPPGSQ